MNMGYQFPVDTIFARLGDDDVPVCCTRARAYRWLHDEGGLRRYCIKRDGIDGVMIQTQFRWFSSDPDVPMFWEVIWYSLSPYRYGERRFGTKDEALAFHAALVSGEERLVDEYDDGYDDDDEDGSNWWKE
jgi:hypothetical protein